MARIRTVKPEFWEDEVVGLLPRDARLLFIATFNLADDEGLLRWTPAYIKASAFMYDDDVTLPEVAKLMQGLADAGLVFPYIAGVAHQQMACVVNFRKHQKINRPQKSKLPPPSLAAPEARRMYARRDGWTCQLCGGEIPENRVATEAHNLAIEHIVPQSAGGTDHPSNVRAAHQACAGGRRGLGDGEEFVLPAALEGLNDSLNESVNGSVNTSMNGSVNDPHTESTTDPERSTVRDISSVNGSVNDSLTNSLPEGKGKEGKGSGKGADEPAAASDDSTLFPSPQPPDKPAANGDDTRAHNKRIKALADHYYDAIGGMSDWQKIRGVVKKAVESPAAYSDDDITRGLDSIVADGRFGLSTESLRIAIQRTSNVRQLRPSGGHQPFRNGDYDTTDPNELDPWPQAGDVK